MTISRKPLLSWTALLFASALSLSSVALAEPGLRVVPVLLPQEQFDEMKPGRDPLVYIDKEEFNVLLDRYRKALETIDVSAETKSPGKNNDAQILDTRIIASEEKGRLDVKTRIRFRLPARGRYIVPLPLASMASSSFTHKGAGTATVLAARRGGHAIMMALLSGKGEQEIEFNCVCPVKRKSNNATSSIHLPGTTIQKLEIRFSPGTIRAFARSGLLNIPLELSASTGKSLKGSLACGGMERIDLSWTRACNISLKGGEKSTAHTNSIRPRITTPDKTAGSVKREAPRLYSRLSSLVMVRDEITLVYNHLNIVNSGGKTSSLDILLPMHCAVKSVSGPMVAGYRRFRNNGIPVLRLSLSRPLKGATELTLLVEESVPMSKSGKARTLSYKSIRLRDAKRQQVSVGIAALSASSLATAHKGRSVRAIDPAELPARIRTYSKTPVILAYDFQIRENNEQPGLVIDVKPFITVKTLETTIHSSNAVSVIAHVQRADSSKETLTSMTRLILQVVNTSRKYLRIRLPSSAEVTGCFVNFEACAPSIEENAEEGETYLVPLIRSIEDHGQLLPYPVSITYKMDIGPRLADMGRLRSSLPEFDVPVSDTSWKIYTPQGFTLFNFDGNLKRAGLTEEFILIHVTDWIFNEIVMKLVFLLLALFFIFVAGYTAFRGGAGLRRLASYVSLPSFSSLLHIMLILAFMGVIAAISVPNFRRARQRANKRACYANMKTIAGAIEMYNLDNNTSVDTVADVMDELLEQGYLQCRPLHPGSNEFPEKVYSLDDVGLIKCKYCGYICDPEKTTTVTGYSKAMEEKTAEVKRQTEPASSADADAGRRAHIAPVNFRIPRTGQFTLLLRSFLEANQRPEFCAAYFSDRSFKGALFLIVVSAGLMVLGLRMPVKGPLKGLLCIFLLISLLVIPGLLDEIDTTMSACFFWGSLLYLLALRGRKIPSRAYLWFKDRYSPENPVEQRGDA